jgi:micrococcal nuclease
MNLAKLSLISLFLLAGCVDENPLMPQQWKVAQVYDGDTIQVENGIKSESVRLCGIDAPELNQPLGVESRDKLRSLLAASGNSVQVYMIGIDQYNRQVGEVFVFVPGGEKFINEEMVHAGMAYHYQKFSQLCPNKIAIANGEILAKNQHLGVWSGVAYKLPWEYRQEKRRKN